MQLQIGLSENNFFQEPFAFLFVFDIVACAIYIRRESQ
jgi:hypothetical protein